MQIYSEKRNSYSRARNKLEKIMRRIAIIGGGFAGTWAAMSAAAERATRIADDIEIMLISDQDSMCVRPRLYEGATEAMMVPLRPLLDEIGVDLTLSRVASVEAGSLKLESGETIVADRTILAAGSAAQFPPVPGAAEHGFQIDDYPTAQRLDAHVGNLQFEDVASGTIVVVGASFSGLEIVTQLRRRMGPAFRLILIDQQDVAGASLGQSLAEPVETALAEADVTFHGGLTISEVTQNKVVLSDGQEIETQTVVFATGMKASALAGTLAASQDMSGRLEVDANLKVANLKTVFAAGDVASAWADPEHRTLMSCQHAMPMGTVAGRNAVLDLQGEALAEYQQPFYATCIDLGPFGAVFTNGWDRQIVKTRAEGAEMKTQINTQWIYPPNPSMGRDAIFEMIRSQ
jgi:NADH dehydrogenase